MTPVFTGFEAFGAHGYNPSWDVARAAAEAVGDAHCERLPVTWATAAAWPERAAERFGDDLLSVHIGLGASREHVCLEARAQNRAGGRADNDGEAREGPVIANDSPADSADDDVDAELTTGLDLESWRDALQAPLADAGLPAARISRDCGSYVCNALYYHVLRRSDRAVFVHVPELAPEEARRAGEVLAGAGPTP